MYSRKFEAFDVVHGALINEKKKLKLKKKIIP